MHAAASTPASRDGAAHEDTAGVGFAALLAPLEGLPGSRAEPVARAPQPSDRGGFEAERAPVPAAIGRSYAYLEQWVKSTISNVPGISPGRVGLSGSDASRVPTALAASRDPIETALEPRRLDGLPIAALVTARGSEPSAPMHSVAVATGSAAPLEPVPGGSGSPPNGSRLPRLPIPTTIGRDPTAEPPGPPRRADDRVTLDRSANQSVTATFDARSSPSPTPMPVGSDTAIESARNAVEPRLAGRRLRPDAGEALGLGDRMQIDTTAGRRSSIERSALGVTEPFSRSGPIDRAPSFAPLDLGSIDRIVNEGPEARAAGSFARWLDGSDRGVLSGSVERPRSTSAPEAQVTLSSGFGDGAKAAAAPPQAATPIVAAGPSPELGRMLGDRLIALANRGEQRARIELHPAELGAVDVHIKLRDDVAAVSISVQHAHARELIEASIPRLREMFAGQGLNLVDVDVSGQRDGGRARADDPEDRAPSPRAWRKHAEPELAPIAAPSRHPTRLIDLFA